MKVCRVVLSFKEYRESYLGEVTDVEAMRWIENLYG